MNTIFALVEEAPFAGDPTKRNVLAHIITNHELAYEMKGVDAEDGKNYTRFMIVSNAEWVAPVEAGDRRCFVIDVSETHKEDKDYFIEIDDEMKLGGAEAMLYDLLELKVRMRDMGKPPMTAAKREQMVLGLKPDMAWLSDVLAAGEFPYADGRTLAWPETGQWKGEQPCPTQDVEAWGLVKKDDVAESFRDFVSTHRGRATSIRVGRFLTKIFPEIRTIRITQERNRPWAYQLPPLEAARKRFLKFNPAFEPMIEPMIDPGSDKPKEQSADAPEASIEDIAAYRSRRSRF